MVLIRPCKDCGENSQTTGKVFVDKKYKEWHVEYVCDECSEVQIIYTPKGDKMVKEKC